MLDRDGLQHTLFPRLRWEKVAPQPAGFQQLVFASTNMMVLVSGQQCREKTLAKLRDSDRQALLIATGRAVFIQHLSFILSPNPPLTKVRNYG